MSNPNTFVNNYVTAVQNLISQLTTLRLMNDEITQDSTLITRYFAQNPATGPAPRTDIAAADVTNAQGAVTQILFTFDSGSPTQKSFLYKMLP